MMSAANREWQAVSVISAPQMQEDDMTSTTSHANPALSVETAPPSL